MTSRRRDLSLGSLERLLGLKLKLAQLRFFETYFDEFGQSGITPAEYSVLELLATNAGVRQGELGAALNIKRSNLSKVMRSLQARDLISRRAPDNDGRAFVVELTAKGAAMRKVLARDMLNNDRSAAQALTLDERKELLRLLDKLLLQKGKTDTAGRVLEEAEHD